MTFNGLPLHVLVVHLTVVTLPLLAVLSLVSLHPRWRDQLRVPAIGLALFAAVLVWFTVKTGESFQHDKFPTPTGNLKTHIDAAKILKWVTYGFAAVAAVRYALYQRAGAVRVVLSGALIVGVVALGYFTFKTGEAGARDSYGSYYGNGR